jgi:hypothetical protein
VVPDVDVPAGGSSSVLDAIRWVLDNSDSLIDVTESGCRKLNADVIAKAPGQAAIFFATILRDEPLRFALAFVSKLLTKQLSYATQDDVSDDDEEAAIKKVDPDIGALDRWLKK